MDNADLEKLKVSQGKLLPKFKASVTSYSLAVASNVEEVKFSPLTADSGASYVVKGADGSKVVKLTEGKTVEVEVIVTAEDGSSTKTYTVLTRRLSADDATLAQLDVSGGVLQPPFSPLFTRYECSLPSGVDSLTLRVKTEDSKMAVAMKNGEPVGTVPLNPGRTLVEVAVTSVSGKTTSVYTITVVKSRLPTTVQLKKKNPRFECVVCCNVVHLPTRIRGSASLYCRACLEELTRTNKTDPFTGEKLEGDNWMEADLACDADLANQAAVCQTATGTAEATMQMIGAKLQASRTEATKTEEVSIKELLCFKYSIDLPRSRLSRVGTAVRRYLHKMWLFTNSYSVQQSTQSHCPRHRSSPDLGRTDWLMNHVAAILKISSRKAENGRQSTCRASRNQVCGKLSLVIL